jgi:hypothetical protein
MDSHDLTAGLELTKRRIEHEQYIRQQEDKKEASQYTQRINDAAALCQKTWDQHQRIEIVESYQRGIEKEKAEREMKMMLMMMRWRLMVLMVKDQTGNKKWQAQKEEPDEYLAYYIFCFDGHVIWYTKSTLSLPQLKPFIGQPWQCIGLHTSAIVMAAVKKR